MIVLQKNSLLTIILSLILFIIISNNIFTNAQTKDYIDIGGYTIVQIDGQKIISSYTLPAGTIVYKDNFVIIANNVDKSSFESYYKVTLPLNSTFINSSGNFPNLFKKEDGSLSTGQFILYDNNGTSIDESLTASLSKSFLRIDPLSEGTNISSWEVRNYTDVRLFWSTINKKSSGKIVVSHITFPSYPNFNKKYSFVALYFDKNNPPYILNIAAENEILKGNPFNIRVSAYEEDSTDILSVFLKYKYIDSEKEFTLPLEKGEDEFYITLYPDKSLIWKILLFDGKEEVFSEEKTLNVKEEQENDQKAPDEENVQNQVEENTYDNQNYDEENNQENNNSFQENEGQSERQNIDEHSETSNDNPNNDSLNNNNSNNNSLNNNSENINKNYEYTKHKKEKKSNSIRLTQEEILNLKKYISEILNKDGNSYKINIYKFFFNHLWEIFILNN